MAMKPDTTGNKAGKGKRGFDTGTQEQIQGSKDPVAKPEHGVAPKMPHERDESARSTGDRMDQPTPVSERQISDARKDIEEGRKDTDRRGIPNDVPGEKRGGS
jgi:hypothetical protein